MKLLRRAFGVLLLLALAVAVSFHIRIQHLVNLPVPIESPSPSDHVADQYYFAYGSNMATRYLYNVRGVRPAHSEPGMVSNYEVSFFGPGVNALEPAFAYLLMAEGKSAHGVLHVISKQDLAQVKESEGALYEWGTLSVELSSGEVVAAQSLVRLSGGDRGVPSTRYLQILIEGASEHGLPEAYVARLQEMSSFYVPGVSELMGDIIMGFVMTHSGKCASVITC